VATIPRDEQIVGFCFMRGAEESFHFIPKLINFIIIGILEFENMVFFDAKEFEGF